MTRKVCVVVTARPSYSRIRSALLSIQRHPKLELYLIAAASAVLDRYGNILGYLDQDGLEIAARVYMVLEGENLTSMAKTTGLGVIELATAFDNLRPDVVVTVADRYETLATAIAASYMNIPVAHVQGGEVTGSIDEKVRHAVTKLSNLHFAATGRAAERLIRMGEDPTTVFVTGCPSIDLAAAVLADPDLNFDPFERYGGVGPRLDTGSGYLVAMQHPVTTEYEEARRQITETLYAVHGMGIPAWWFWPNVDAGSGGTSKGIRMFREHVPDAQIHFFRSMAPGDFLRLVCHSSCVVGNSSVAIRECSYLGVPAVNIGSRQTGRERGPNVLDVEYDRRAIASAIQKQMRHGRYPQSNLYGDAQAGDRIAQLLVDQPLRIAKRLAY